MFRDGHERTLTVTPEKFPPAVVDGLVWERLGVKVSAARGGLLVVGVRRGSQAAQRGLEPGDLITRLDNEPVGSMEAFRDGLMSSHGRDVLLSVRRGPFTYPLGFRF